MKDKEEVKFCYGWNINFGEPTEYDDMTEEERNRHDDTIKELNLKSEIALADKQLING